MIIKTFDITGFGGSYEATCQRMLWNAVRFVLSDHKEIKSKQSPQIYGIAINEGEDGKEFDKAMMEGIEDATGAMHHCATDHALYIKEHGYKSWFKLIEIVRKKENEEAYDFEYTPDFDLRE